MRHFFWAVVAVCTVSACQTDPAADLRFACRTDRQCTDDYICQNRVCVDGERSDARPPEPEADMPHEPEPDAMDADVVDVVVEPVDSDGDGWPDDMDNCPRIANEQTDSDGDGDGDACDDDRDGDGSLNVNDNCRDVFNPEQADRNANGIGDACEVPCENAGASCGLIKISCGAQDACGSEYTVFEYMGLCDGAFCGEFASDAIDVAASSCGLMEVCQPDPQVPCAPVPVCPADDDCRPEMDGAVCQLGAEPDRAARCVDGRCRAWECVLRECNELGPRHFSLEEGISLTPIMPPIVRVQQMHLNLAWAFVDRQLDAPAPPVASLAEAHRRCTTLIFDGHADWRVPTMHELHALAASSGTPAADSLGILARTAALYFSRTVVDDAHVMGISLTDGIAGPIPLDQPAQLVCVREEEQAIRNLTTRRQAFTDWRLDGEVRDPYTELEWLELPGQFGFEEALYECERIDARLPSTDALVSLMTFNIERDRIEAGVWVDWDGMGLQPRPRRVWSRTASPVDGEHLYTDFGSGQVIAARDGVSLEVLCLRLPDDPE